MIDLFTPALKETRETHDYQINQGTASFFYHSVRRLFIHLQTTNEDFFLIYFKSFRPSIAGNTTPTLRYKRWHFWVNLTL